MNLPPEQIAQATKPDGQPTASPVTAPAIPSATPPFVPPVPLWKRKSVLAVAAIIVVAAASLIWIAWRPSGLDDGFASGNGRTEATEVDIASKLGGRVQDILVNEGDFVQIGQLLARMQIDTLEAERKEARAQSQRAVDGVAIAAAQVDARKSDKAAAMAMVVLRESELDSANRLLVRSETLSKEGIITNQKFDDDRARAHGAAAAVTAAQAQVEAAQAAIIAAQAQVRSSNSSVVAADATIARIEVDIQDSQLKSPRDGRVQYRIAQPGEVLAAGGKVLNLVDLGEVYLTFFLPETAAGKVALGSEVHIIIDAAPQYVIPAKVTYVSSTAQFTPKAVETASERQKLMFRVKAQIDRDLLTLHLKLVKTGMPGVAWLKLDPHAVWPKNLQIKVPK